MKGVPYPFNENQVIAPKTELVLVAFDTLPEVNRKYYLDAGVHLNNKRVLDVEFVFNLDVLGVDFGISDEISYGNLRNVIEFTDAKKIFTTLQDDRRKAFFLSLPMPSLYRPVSYTHLTLPTSDLV